MFNDEVTLVSISYIIDEDMNQTEVETKEVVLCEEKSVGRTEFYQAGASGLNASIIIKMKKYEYEGQTEIEFKGKRYNVIRTYSKDFEHIELTCEKLKTNLKGLPGDE